MPEQVYIGNFASGLALNRTAFVINNDAFPFLFNFYVWRGRLKRKRGTTFLGILQIQQSISASPARYQAPAFNLVGGAGNLIVQYSLPSTATISPGFMGLIVSGQTYTDPNKDGTLTGNGGGTGTINYVTGDFTITGGGVNQVTGTYSYYPGRPVMGLRQFDSGGVTEQYPLLLSFDTQNSYQLNQTVSPPNFYNVTFYKYTNIPFAWSAADSNQFWTTNYVGALWATNSKAGFHFVGGNYVSGSPGTTITFNFKSNSAIYTTLENGDRLWFNEWSDPGVTINGLVGTVTDNSGKAAGNYVVTFTDPQTVSGVGIAELLTNSITGQDGIRWYDGDPTNSTGIAVGNNLGWVNFSPPLSTTGQTIRNSSSTTPFYLVGALAITAFKARLMFVNAYIQNVTDKANGIPGTLIQLEDTIIFSWYGTPYYNSVIPTGSAAPSGLGFDNKAYYTDQTGLGGYVAAGISQPISTVGNNEDVLLIGFGGNLGRKTRFVYTDNALEPFLFYTINSELPSQSTFASVVLDNGTIDMGPYGIALTDQQSSQRIDAIIPDSIFQVQAANSGTMRVNAARDFRNEWIYFCYPLNTSPWKYPTQTFLLNYRDNTWAVLYENFTAHGTYRQNFKNTWTSIGRRYKTWAQWRDPWNSGNTSEQFPEIVAGNPQGYVLIKDTGTAEAVSGTILGISSNGGNIQINSINHCTQQGDYIQVVGVLGLLTSTITAISQASVCVITTNNTFAFGNRVTISGVIGMTELNGNTYTVIAATATTITIDVDSTNFTAYVSGGTVTSAINNLIGLVIKTVDADNFVLDLAVPVFTSVYLGGGQYVRLSQPLMQTKQFNPYWQQGRQARLSVQKYIMDRTANAQVSVNIFLSQDPNDVWNDPAVYAEAGALIYSTVMFTCPESVNIGLSPFNTNLQMPTAIRQDQIWHRFNTSLIGDSFQVGLTLNDQQMRNYTYATSEITLHGIHLTFNPGPHLA